MNEKRRIKLSWHLHLHQNDIERLLFEAIEAHGLTPLRAEWTWEPGVPEQSFVRAKVEVGEAAYHQLRKDI